MVNPQLPTALFELEPLGLDLVALRESIMRHLTYDLGKTPQTATERDWFYSLTYAIRDRLVERLMETFHGYYQKDHKRLYYLSLEFLIGRSLINSLLALGLEKIAREVLPVNIDFDRLRVLEEDAGLGNGGLGRLAACILDSLATLDLPGYGYGIRYDYGMFTQRIENGWQVEHPENWLRYGNPWEFQRPEVIYPVHFFGWVVQFTDDSGQLRSQWIEADQVMAMACDFPIPGYGTRTVNNLRLWTAKSTRDFELKDFNEGNYIRAVENKTASENLSRVLYPNDATAVGRELRLRQEYFFISASLQDILRR
ncbi:MAG: glycogen/starch/alpha-glucan phosphorylase, partial [Pseudomonadota bacterium]